MSDGEAENLRSTFPSYMAEGERLYLCGEFSKAIQSFSNVSCTLNLSLLPLPLSPPPFPPFSLLPALPLLSLLLPPFPSSFFSSFFSLPPPGLHSSFEIDTCSGDQRSLELTTVSSEMTSDVCPHSQLPFWKEAALLMYSGSQLPTLQNPTPTTILLLMKDLFVCLSTTCMHAYFWKPEEGNGSLGTGITGC